MTKLKAGKDYIGVGGGVLILNRKGETLLLKRGGKSKNQIGWWSKPGGSVEYGEQAQWAMEREIEEELGIKIKIWGYLPHTDHIIKREDQHWVAVNYLASVKAGIPRNMEPHKCDEIGWFSLKRLPKKLAQTTRESAKNYLAGKYIKL
ncbi:NUDIX domain-containing protein [Patescibacteria group bacterium]|nr:MAG: NUDIX domain-containing protein [Patescibacteria group bacterium]